VLKLKRHSQFQRTYKRGARFKEENLIMCLAANRLGQNRIGISVSSACVPQSVKRNRNKRLLSESCRLTERLVKGRGFDIVFIVRKDMSRLYEDNIREMVLKLYKKSRMIE